MTDRFDMFSKDDLNWASRRDLHVFADRAFTLKIPNFRHFSYLDIVGAKLAEATERAARLVVNLPPRHGKTWYLVALIAWYLGRHPENEVMFVTHSRSLARDVAAKARELIGSPLFTEVFPQLRISADRDATMDFRTSAGGGYVAGSFESGLTGRGASLLIIDDPISGHEADSATVRDSVRKAFDGMLMSRLNNPATDSIIMVGHRVHADDLSQHLLEKGFEALILPFMAIEDENIEARGVVFKRRKGEILQPGRFRRADFDGMDARVFAAQYQQRPETVRGGLLLRRHFPIESSLPGNGEIVISWDTASSESPRASYSVALVFQHMGDVSYLRHVFRERVEFGRLKDVAFAFHDRYRPKLHLIEKAHMGDALAEALKEVGAHVLLEPTRNQSKIERVNAQMHKIEAQRLHVHKDAIGAENFLSEIEAFPHGPNDDQVDALVQFLAWVGTAIPKKELGILGSGRRLDRSTRAGFIAGINKDNHINSQFHGRPWPRKR